MSLSKAAFVLVHGVGTIVRRGQGRTPARSSGLRGSNARPSRRRGQSQSRQSRSAFAHLTPLRSRPSGHPSQALRRRERTQAVVALVREGAPLGDGKVILVGHSAGGLTISAVAEQVPELLFAVVYLSGFMLPNGMQVFEMLQHETLSSSLGPGLFVGNPATTGATRINAGSGRRRLQIAAQSHVLRRRVGVAIRAGGVATSLR